MRNRAHSKNVPDLQMGVNAGQYVSRCIGSVRSDKNGLRAAPEPRHRRKTRQDVRQVNDGLGPSLEPEGPLQ